jgi:hypothetical protein
MSRYVAVALLLIGCDPGGPPRVARVQQANTVDGLADRAFGQPDLTSGTELLLASSNTTHRPIGVAAAAVPSKVDTNPIFWVADQGANRVLGAFSNDAFAQLLAGQYSFNQRQPNHGGIINAQALNAPTAVAFSYEQVAIADTGNHRVILAYRTSGFPLFPFSVFGQHNRYDTANRNDGGAITADTLADPSGVAFDATFAPGRLLVADTGNHRVVAFNIVATSPPATTAAQCFGQDDCSKGLPNRGGAVSATGFNEPRGLATDNTIGGSLRGFYVADTGNHRVLHFPVFATMPDLVYGQDGDFTSAVPSKGGVSSSSLRSPNAVAVDPVDGSIYVADTGHHRVLHFPKGKTVADRVLGQPDFRSSEAPLTASASRMRAPTGVALTMNELFVADSGFARVLRFRTCDAKCDDFDPCTDDTCDPTGKCLNTLRPHPKACAPYFCDASTKTCSRPCDASHPCQPPFHKCINGTCAIPCTTNAQCTSTGRTCVDGYCCDGPCNGPCERCNELGNEGTCKPVPEGPPVTERSCGPGDLTGECGLRCDGFDGSSCKIARAGAACGPESCAGDVVSKRGRCNGTGTCEVVTASCAPYACSVNACRTTCRFDYDCAAGATCANGACVEGSGSAGAGGGCAYDRRANGLAALIVIAAMATSIVRRRR